MNVEIQRWRYEIDAIDRELLELFTRIIDGSRSLDGEVLARQPGSAAGGTR